MKSIVLKCILGISLLLTSCSFLNNSNVWSVKSPDGLYKIRFTDMDNPHLTTFAHELALSVLFQSGITHFADKPEGYLAQPEAVQQFLKNVPVTWDDIKFLQGEPGKYVVLARRSGENWYIAGINGLEQDKIVSIDLNQFDAGEALFIGDKEARALTYRNIPEEHRS